MASKDFYRMAARRTHRTLGSYLVQWAWANNVDCVVIKSKDYLRLLGMKRMQDKRMEWITDDLKSIFPYIKPIPRLGSKMWTSIYLSRHRFPKGVFDGSSTVEKRIKRMNDGGVRAAVAQLLDEAGVVEAMARVACGLEDFKGAPWAA